jgi:hypothetical protein
VAYEKFTCFTQLPNLNLRKTILISKINFHLKRLNLISDPHNCIWWTVLLFVSDAVVITTELKFRHSDHLLNNILAVFMVYEARSRSMESKSVKTKLLYLQGGFFSTYTLVSLLLPEQVAPLKLNFRNLSCFYTIKSMALSSFFV